MAELRLEQFSGKIKSIKEIKGILGEPPREEVMVLCHGSFDQLHPGHRRLFSYAKRVDGNQQGKLVVGVVNDQALAQKQPHPYLPQELRAVNVAAHPDVDLVYISPNPTPEISSLKPDYFVTGYNPSDSLAEILNEQRKLLNLFGGELILAPGDTTYPSLDATNSANCPLNPEQMLLLKSIMENEHVFSRDLRNSINRFSRVKAHVIGDLIVDKYTACINLGQAQKEAAFSAVADGTVTYIGGAGIVAKHLHALGAKVTFTTVVGEDETADFAIEDIRKAGVIINAIVDPTRPTTVKERFRTDNRILLQVDRVDNRPIAGKTLENFIASVEAFKGDATICSDFRHGIFNENTTPHITRAISADSFKVGDSQVSKRWGNILDFPRFHLITPNEKEARHALGDQDSSIGTLARKLYQAAQCRYLILKLGKEGILTLRNSGSEFRSGFPISSFADQVIDPVGAGDALLSAATATLVVSENIVQAAILGNLAAAIECSKFGNIPVTSTELLHKIQKLHQGGL